MAPKKADGKLNRPAVSNRGKEPSAPPEPHKPRLASNGGRGSVPLTPTPNPPDSTPNLGAGGTPAVSIAKAKPIAVKPGVKAEANAKAKANARPEATTREARNQARNAR